MLGLLECEPESWRLQNVRGATEVLDAPRDRGKPLEVRDFLVQSKGLFTTNTLTSSWAGAAVEASSELAVRGRTSESAAA